MKNKIALTIAAIGLITIGVLYFIETKAFNDLGIALIALFTGGL